jgi:hypothetical protein
MLLGREPHLLSLVRVPVVYLSSAFLSLFLSERGMNNLRVCSGLDGSIPTAPTNLLSYQHVKRPLVFQPEHLFQLTAAQCVPWSHAATAE